MSKIKNGLLDEYGAKLSEQQWFAPAGIEGVKFDNGNRKGHSKKLFKRKRKLNLIKFVFGDRVVDYWNGLSGSCINCSTISVKKSRMPKIFGKGSRLLLFMWPKVIFITIRPTILHIFHISKTVTLVFDPQGHSRSNLTVPTESPWLLSKKSSLWSNLQSEAHGHSI